MFPFGKFPYHKYMDQFLKHMNTTGMDEHTKNLMSSAFSGSMSDFFKNHDFFRSVQDTGSGSGAAPPSSRKLDSHVFETLDQCIVQIKIPDKSILQHIKIIHTPNQCII